MPIPVTCPKCKTTFKVSDKFAGKQGPCPKCKTLITVPDAVPETEDVKIHGPEDAPPGKTTTGGASLKPIVRKQSRVNPVALAIGICGTLAVLAAAWVAGKQLRTILALRVSLLALVSIPIVYAGYLLLKDDELETHSGAVLWLRCLICGLVYAGSWGLLHLVLTNLDLSAEPFYWVFVAPPLILLGAGVAFATLDMDFANGALHYFFYVTCTLLLGWLAGLAMPWTPPPRTTPGTAATAPAPNQPAKQAPVGVGQNPAGKNAATTTAGEAKK